MTIRPEKRLLHPLNRRQRRRGKGGAEDEAGRLRPPIVKFKMNFGCKYLLLVVYSHQHTNKFARYLTMMLVQTL